MEENIDVNINDKFYNDGKGFDGRSATSSVQEIFNRRGFVVDFENKIIFQYLDGKLTDWTKNYLLKTYPLFNLNDFEIKRGDALKIGDYNLVFDTEKNIFEINNRKFIIEKTLNINTACVKVFKTKLRCYDGIRGLFEHILFYHFSNLGAEKFLSQIYNK